MEGLSRSYYRAFAAHVRSGRVERLLKFAKKHGDVFGYLFHHSAKERQRLMQGFARIAEKPKE